MGKPKAADVLNVLIALLILWVCGICAWVVLHSERAQNVKLLPNPAQNYNVGWYYVDEDGKNVYIPTLPAKVPVDYDGKARIFHNYVAYSRKTICFFTHHQNAAIFLNGIELYHFTLEGNPPWLKSFRALYHIVNLPIVQDSTICLEIDGLIKGRDGEFNEVYMGDRSTILYRLMTNRADKLGLGISLSIFGVIVMLLGFTTISSVNGENRDLSLVYLGMTGLCLGIWQLEESRCLQFFFGNQALHWCLEYMLQFGILAFGLLFTRTVTPVRMTGVTNIFTGCILYFAGLELVLQLTGTLQITSSALLMYILFIALSFYIAFLIVFTLKFSNRILKSIFCASMGVSILLFLSVILMGSKRSKNSTDFWLTVALLFMFFSLSVVVYQKTVEKFEAMKEAKLYEKLALVDFNTGVSSKTAWFYLVEKFDYAVHVGQIYCLIMFDMNNLKKLNDTYGHLVGDKVISAFCDCMRDIFGSKGEIYRIGGDEFICLLEGLDEDDVKALLAQFDKQVENQKETDHKFTVAYGWAMFKPHSRDDFIAAQQRADSQMYDMKKRMKAIAAMKTSSKSASGDTEKVAGTEKAAAAADKGTPAVPGAVL